MLFKNNFSSWPNSISDDHTSTISFSTKSEPVFTLLPHNVWVACNWQWLLQPGCEPVGWKRHCCDLNTGSLSCNISPSEFLLVWGIHCIYKLQLNEGDVTMDTDKSREDVTKKDLTFLSLPRWPSAAKKKIYIKYNYCLNNKFLILMWASCGSLTDLVWYLIHLKGSSTLGDASKGFFFI